MFDNIHVQGQSSYFAAFCAINQGPMAGLQISWVYCSLQVLYLSFFRKDSGLVMVKDQGGDPRQNGRPGPAALVQYYQSCSIILGKGIGSICAVYVVTLGQEVCLNVAGSQGRQSPMQSCSCKYAAGLPVLCLWAECASNRPVLLDICCTPDRLHLQQQLTAMTSAYLRTVRQHPCQEQARSCHLFPRPFAETPSRLSKPLFYRANHSWLSLQTVHGSIAQVT